MMMIRLTVICSCLFVGCWWRTNICNSDSFVGNSLSFLVGCWCYGIVTDSVKPIEHSIKHSFIQFVIFGMLPTYANIFSFQQLIQATHSFIHWYQELIHTVNSYIQQLIQTKLIQTFRQLIHSSYSFRRSTPLLNMATRSAKNIARRITEVKKQKKIGQDPRSCAQDPARDGGVQEETRSEWSDPSAHLEPQLE